METPLPAAAADARGGSYGALKASLLALQSATAALTQRCEVASLELLDEKECGKETMFPLPKALTALEEVEHGRLTGVLDWFLQYLHAPDSGMALFMEQTKPEARSLQPTVESASFRCGHSLFPFAFDPCLMWFVSICFRPHDEISDAL
ncbi:hypothetical protein BBJ28_00005552 [Nothophytophthora sp. Chile5]|nr:hypothetical protein BBJ28_00005552 [Nothophytophthora sp. Chile5]